MCHHVRAILRAYLNAGVGNISIAVEGSQPEWDFHMHIEHKGLLRIRRGIPSFFPGFPLGDWLLFRSMKKSSLCGGEQSFF